MNIAEASTIKGFDVELLRINFPILAQKVNGHQLVYLDNAATTQKPESVIEAIAEYYRNDNANVHRGVHALSDRATSAFEQARETVAQFINSPSSRQVLWTGGTTEAINLVAHSWARSNLQHGDRVLVSWLEHHANIVPWQLISAECGAEVLPIPIDVNGDIDLDEFDQLLDDRVKLVAISHVSNVLGTVNPVSDICQRAKRVGAVVLVDGAQAVAHWPLDVQSLGCDFYAFSGHKLFGPTGIGVLWGRESLLNAMPPFLGGGEMIDQVSFNGTTFNTLPFKFEAGTPNIAGAVGLTAAINYLQSLDRAAVIEHEEHLLKTTIERAQEVPGLRRIGSPREAAGIFSFVMDDMHPSDLGLLLDQQGIAVRTGHHCAQPLMTQFDVSGTVRVSYSIYNTFDDVDRLFAGLHKAAKMLL